MGQVDIWFVNLGIRITDLHKSFQIGGFSVAYYGVIIGVAMLLAVALVCWNAKDTGQNPEDYIDLGLYAVIFGIIGARLYYVIFNWSIYKDNPLQIFNLRAGGLAIYGGILAGAVTVLVFSKIRKISFLKLADTAVIGVVLGQIIGRWGNFINCEAFGGYTDNLFAMRLNVDLVNDYMISEELLDHLVTVDGVTYIQVHPTFLYECLWNLAVLLILLWMRRRTRFEGELLCLYLAGYGLGRFWIEGLRTDQLKLFGTGIAVSQLLSAVLVVASVTVILYQRKKRRAAAQKKPEEEIPD